MRPKTLGGACLILGIAALVGACQGGPAGSRLLAGATPGNAQLAAEATVQPARTAAEGFELQVLPDSFLTKSSTAEFVLDVGPWPAGNFYLTTTPTANTDVAVTIAARDAVDLRALYCDLRYDPARYTPVAVEHLPWTAASESRAEEYAEPPGDILTLEVLNDPGVVHLGQVLAHWDQRAGLTGNADLARVQFAARPFAKRREASATLPVATERPLLTVIMQPAWLDWRWHQVGDYNQDGLVTASDLTPLGARFGERGEEEAGIVEYPDGTYGHRYDFAGGDVRQLYDTSENGAIDIYDITAIGVNFGRGADSFAIYCSAGPAAYSADGPAAVEPLVVFPLSQVRRGNPDEEQVVFNTPLPGLVDGSYYWIQLLNAGSQGMASEFTQVDLSLVEGFSAQLGEECFIDGGYVDSLHIEVGTSGERVTVDTIISGYEQIRYFSVLFDYDVTKFRIDSWSDAWGCYETSGNRAVMPPVSSMPTFNLCRLIADAKVFAMREFDGAESRGDWRIARAFFARGDGTTAYYYDSWLPDHLAYQFLLDYDPATQELSWYYNLPGDMNQDTLVQFDDILMLLRLQGRAVPNFTSPESIADLNADGVVSVGDLTPLAAYNYLYSHFEGYRVYMGNENSYRNDGAGAQLLGSVSVLEDAIGERFYERLHFQFHVDAPETGQLLWIAPYIGDEAFSPLGNYAEIP